MEYQGLSSDWCCHFIEIQDSRRTNAMQCCKKHAVRCCFRTIFYRSKCVYSNNCSLLYFSRFVAKNILSINLKVHFTRWLAGHYGMLPVMSRSILMYYLILTSCIQLKNQKIKTLNVSSVMENSPKMNEEKFGLSVLCGRTCIVLQQRTQSIFVTFIQRIEVEIDFI